MNSVRLRAFVYLYWALLIGMVARTTLFIRKRDTGQFDSVDASANIAIALVGLGLLMLLVSPGLKSTFRALFRNSSLYLLVYVLLSITSFVWSLNPNFTLFRGVEVLVVFLLTSSLMSCYANFEQAEKRFLQFATIVIIFELTYRFRFTVIGIADLHTNLYSSIAAMGTLYCLGEYFSAAASRKRALKRFGLFFLFFLALGTSSASNVSTAAGFIALLFLLRAGKVQVFSVVFVLAVVLVSTGEVTSFLQSVLFPFKSDNQITTFTGRTHLWDVYVRLFEDRPFQGYGFAIISRLGSQFGTVSTTNTHNGYLEVLLGTGLIGGIFFFTWMIKLGLEGLRNWRLKVPGAVGFLGAFMALLVNNLARSNVGGAFDPVLVVSLVMVSFFTFHINIRRRIYQH